MSESFESTFATATFNQNGTIKIDGSLADWRSIDRLDAAARQQVAGYRVYGKNTDNGYAIAIDSSQVEIGINTTIWLNIDRNKTTGYQVFGSTVGAEYNINIAADGKPYLHSGAAGENFISAVDFARSSDGKTIEIIIPKAITSTAQMGIDAYIDVNDRVFITDDYVNNSLSIGSMSLLSRNNSSKRIAIVYSETSANNYFDKKAYSQLFANAQAQAIAAGIPFDLITEADLKSVNNLVNYDALVFPSFSNINKADSLALDRQIDNYFQYYTGVGTAYNNAFGFLEPTAKAVYFAPNISFDFNAIGFQKLTSAQTAGLWEREYNQLNRSRKPIIEFGWHDYGATGADPNYDPAIYDNFIARAAADGTEFVTFDDAQNRIRTFAKSQVSTERVGDTINARVTPDTSTAGVGKFSLDIQSSQPIKNVSNYYAFDNNSVFLTKTGGDYQINLGAGADNVTHIVALAQRAELLSVTGDGSNLDYTFNGEGNISIDLNIPTGQGITATGADRYSLVDSRLEMTFNRATTHTAAVKVGSTQGTTGNDLLLGGSSNSSLIGVDPNSTAGKGEIDTLIGAGNRDSLPETLRERFILGDANRVYYNDGDSTTSGINDYANIVGFLATTGDVIQLQGTAADYSLGTAPAGVNAGTAIYNNLSGEPELIGIVQNTSGLSLTDGYFNYV